MDEVRFGLMGFGGWGSHHAAAIQKTDGARLVAITTRSDGSRERATLAYPETQVHADLNEFLARDDLDVICVALPSDFHHPAARLVLESGRHLLLEKPMALEVDQCDELIELAARQGKRLMIGHEFRLSTVWGQIKALVEQGAIGEPRFLSIELWRQPFREGIEGWRFDAARVGSWIHEGASHFFDLARWYLAEVGEPQSLYAQTSARQSGPADLHDNFTTIVNFPQGAYAVISQSTSAFEHHQTVKLTGSRGTLWGSVSAANDRTWQPTCSLKYEQNGKIEEIALDGPSGELFELREEMAMVVDVVRGRSLPAVTGHDGRWAVAMCRAAQQSLAEGQVVSLQPPPDAPPETEDLLVYTPRRRRAQRSIPIADNHGRSVSP